MKKIIIFAAIFSILLVLTPLVFLSGQDYGDDNATQLGDFVRKECLIYVYHPLFRSDFTMDDMLEFEDRLGITHKSYDFKNVIFKENHVIYVLKYRSSVIIIFHESPDNRLLNIRIDIKDMDIPLRGQLRMGMEKKEFCEYIGVPYEKYININKISIALYEAPVMPIEYIFNASEELVAIYYYLALNDKEYWNME